MTPDLYRTVREIFVGACEVEPKGLPEYLDRACAGNEALRAEVDSLLVHRRELAGFLDEPVLGDALDQVTPESLAPSSPRNADAGMPRRFGSFTIRGVLGEGGMGVVYIADQDHPRRTVALKVIRPGLVSARTLRRFEQEEEVLARLRHPGIAQIYEAGAVDDGEGPQPFYAMELIEGDAITTYADKNGLGMRERLKLLVKVCHAVQHAHQKGVIHRDLKPANILVDVECQPKILDFGVARAIDSEKQATLLTTDGQIVGTIPYMSPEQIEGDTNGLDTRSDVYALGVLGYELLTGRLPHDVSRKTIPEAARMICETDPRRLSSVNRIFRGDLETIFTKALEKEKERRYATAADLAGDVERYLRDEPIAAHPAGAVYQIRKFTRRHKAIVIGALAVLVVLIGGVVATSWQAVRATSAGKRAQDSANRARREAVKATAVGAFLQRMLSSPDPDQDGRMATVAEVMARAAAEIDASFADEPEIRAALHHTVGHTYLHLAMFQEAEAHLRTALDLRSRLLGDEHPDTLTSAAAVASLLWSQGKQEDAVALLEKTLETDRRVLGEENPVTTAAVVDLSYLLKDQGKLEEATTLVRRVLEIRRRTLGADHLDTLDAEYKLAGLLNDQGQVAEAEAIIRRTIEIRKRRLGDEHSSTLDAQATFAALLHDEGRLNEAEVLERQIVQAKERVFGKDHPSTLIAESNLAFLLQQESKYEEAERLCRETLEKRRQKLGEGHPQTLVSMDCLAGVLQRQGKLDDAEALYREVLAARLRDHGFDHVESLVSLTNMAEVRLRKGEYSQAASIYGQALADCLRVLGEVHTCTLRARIGLGACLTALHRFEEAEAELLKTHSTLETRFGGKNELTSYVLRQLIELYKHWGKPEKMVEYQSRLDGSTSR